jgi:hypothetical protein
MDLHTILQGRPEPQPGDGPGEWKEEPITIPATCHGCRERFRVITYDSVEYARVFRNESDKWERYHADCWPWGDRSEDDAGELVAGILALVEMLAKCDDAINQLGFIDEEVRESIDEVSPPASPQAIEQPAPLLKVLRQAKPQRLRETG